MASYLRPRRGKAATATSQNIVLKRGEVFFEVPTGGVGTGLGKIKMGDGSTAYSSLPYFMEQVDVDDEVVGFTNSTAATASSNNSTYLTNIAPTASLKTLFTNMKQLLLNYNSQLTSLNNDLANISVGNEEVVSDQKRYIHGYESLLSGLLPEFTDTNVSNLTTIHIDEITVTINDIAVSVSEQNLTLSSGSIGTNYYVEVSSDGTVSIATTKTNSTTMKCIGGFHYGRVRNSTTTSDTTLGIIPNSVWTLKWRPRCSNPDAMVYIGINKKWGDIYLTRVSSAASTTIGGAVYDCSAYNALPGTGTEGFAQYTFVEALAKVGKQLSSHEEFVIAADGSPEGLDSSNTNAWTSSSNSARNGCGLIANAVSSLNVCDLVGNVWKWNRDYYELNNGGTSYGWHDQGSTGKGDTYGPGSYGIGALISGGLWNGGSHCGSRCSGTSDWPWHVYTDGGAWGVADSI